MSSFPQYLLSIGRPRAAYALAPGKGVCYTQTRPSINKGKHACQCVFPALFALFTLACASKPASQKAKITRKSIAGRCFAKV